MRRIAVLGCSGAGKSRLSEELGCRLELPAICLDAHYWNPGWKPTPTAEWERRERQLLSGDAWVADGHYLATLHARADLCDTLVYLDRSRFFCLRNVVTRWWKHRGGSVRASMSPGCPEKVDGEFIRWIWGFPKHARPRTMEVLEGFRARGGSVHVLRSDGDRDSFLDSCGA
ncbi:MAG: P-loop NTPase family protein [Planctomycetota bacterium]|jgi:adenylate kinase family enzyme